MSNPTNVQDATKKTIQIFKGICKGFDLNHTIEIDPDNPANDEDALLFINDGEQYIYIELRDIDLNEDMFGRIKGKRIHYTVQHEVMIHGVRYYPDGSGEPDCSDVVDDSVHSNPYDAVGQSIKLNFGWSIDNCLESEALCESEREAEEAWEEYCRDMERDLENAGGAEAYMNGES